MIERIEIQYFRSIYQMKIRNIESINVITGRNDAGKSNILKALNLFFNNCIVESGDFVFKENYNLKRLEEVRKETIKGKQFIQIKITFTRGNQFEKTLPEQFTVTKKWNRDSEIPQVSDNLEYALKRKGKICNNTNRASLTKYMNKMRFQYVPAIKDKHIFDSLLRELQDTVYSKKLAEQNSFLLMMENLHKKVQETTEDLSIEFFNATGIESYISTPKEADELYKTLRIDTSYDGSAVSLENRGDGIRVRYLPSILNYIATNSKELVVWGFEEPENSLEFNLASKMASDFYYTYSRKCQIFLTTHSPAFIDLGTKNNCSGYRSYKTSGETKVVLFKDASDIEALAEELGYARILQKQYEEYKRLIDVNDQKAKVIAQLQKSIADSRLPVLLTEGKTDAMIVLEAWKRIRKGGCPFRVESCDLLGPESSAGGFAGASMLRTILCGIRYDSERLIIGLFDKDSAGNKEYRALSNYKESQNKKWKIHKTNKALALQLPYDDDLKKIAIDAENLSIEFYFDKEHLLNNDLPQPLLKVPQEERRINGRVIRQQQADMDCWYYFNVDKDLKVPFAKDVVPNLPDEAFAKFSLLFDTLDEMIASNS